MRGKGRRWSGHDSGKWGRCLSSAAAGRPCDRLWARRDLSRWRFAERTGASLRGRSVGRMAAPAREKNRRRRVLVVAICSPRPIRAVQRARLWAITCTASQAPLAAKRPDGMWFSPTPYLRSRMAGRPASSSRVSPSRSVMKPYDVAAAEWVMRGKGRRWSGHDSGKWGRWLTDRKLRKVPRVDGALTVPPRVQAVSSRRPPASSSCRPRSPPPSGRGPAKPPSGDVG